MDILWIEMAYNLESEGQPKAISAADGQQTCQLGVGDGSDLENPVAAVAPPAAPPAAPTTDSAIATPAQAAPKHETTFVAKRSAVKFVA